MQSVAYAPEHIRGTFLPGIPGIVFHGLKSVGLHGKPWKQYCTVQYEYRYIALVLVRLRGFIPHKAVLYEY